MNIISMWPNVCIRSVHLANRGADEAIYKHRHPMITYVYKAITILLDFIGHYTIHNMYCNTYLFTYNLIYFFICIHCTTLYSSTRFLHLTITHRCHFQHFKSFDKAVNIQGTRWLFKHRRKEQYTFTHLLHKWCSQILDT